MKNKRSTGIVLSYVFLILNMIIGLFMSSYVIHRLGSTEYGLYQAVGAFANYLVLLEFGTGTVMTRNLSVYRATNNKASINKCISTMWIITLVLSLLITVVSIVFMLNIKTIYKHTMTDTQSEYACKVFVFIIINLLISFYQSTANGMLLGFENYTFSNIIRLLKLIIRTLCVIVALYLWPMAVALTITDSILSVIVLLLTVFYCRRKYSVHVRSNEFDLDILKESLPLCFALLLQTVVNQANNEVDKTILGIRMSLESVSIYSVAQYIYSMFSSLTTVPITMYIPQVAKSMSSGLSGKKLTNTLIQPCRLVVIIGGMIMFGFISVGRQFLMIMYGEQYTPTWIYAIIIIVPMFINMTNGVAVNVLDVLGKRMIRSYILGGTTVLNIVLTIILIERIGIIGAVIATAISVIIGQDILMNVYYKKKIGLEVIDLFKDAYKGLIPVEVIACIISFIVSSRINNVFFSMLIGGCIFLLLCFMGFYLWGFNSIERSHISAIVARCLRRFH